MSFQKISGLGHFWTPFFHFFSLFFKNGYFWHFVYFSDANFIKSGQKVAKNGPKMGSQNQLFFSFFKMISSGVSTIFLKKVGSTFFQFL